MGPPSSSSSPLDARLLVLSLCAGGAALGLALLAASHARTVPTATPPTTTTSPAAASTTTSARDKVVADLLFALNEIPEERFGKINQPLREFLVAVGAVLRGESPPSGPPPQPPSPKIDLAPPPPTPPVNPSHTTQNATENNNNNNDGHDPYERFRRMVKLGVPLQAVENKMRVEGMDPARLSDSSSKENKPQDPRLDRYRSMLKVGVPLPAVRLKMSSEGLDPNLLEDIGRETTESRVAPEQHATPLKPPPPPPSAPVRKIKLERAPQPSHASLWEQQQQHTGNGHTLPPHIYGIVDALFSKKQNVTGEESADPPCEDKENAHRLPLSAAGKKSKSTTTNNNNKTQTESKERYLPPVLPARRVQNVQIGLTKFKLSPTKLSRAIASLDFDALGGMQDEDSLQLLCNLLPTDEEARAISNAMAVGANPHQLKLASPVERWFHELSTTVPSARSRLNAMMFMCRFSQAATEVEARVGHVRSAISSAHHSASVRAVLHTILAAGNAINHDDHAASGLSIHGLAPVLLSAKTPCGRYTFADTVAALLRARKGGEEEETDLSTPLFKPQQRLCNVAALRKDVSELVRGIATCEEFQDEAGDGGEAKAALLAVRNFVTASRVHAQQLTANVDEIEIAYRDLLVYFGEDPTRPLVVFFDDLKSVMEAVDSALLVSKIPPALLLPPADAHA